LIILDFNQVIIANLMRSIGNGTKNIEIDINVIRPMVLKSVAAYRKNHKAKFGELVLACDSKDSWRKEAFPYYKVKRKKERDKSAVDWKQVFACLDTIREEIKANFPYRVIQVHRAEADDIIGALVHQKLGAQLGGEPILIISADKDFLQLQTYSNVYQIDPLRTKTFMRTNDPETLLKKHIITGDSIDSVPNILSQDNSYAIGVRCKALRKTMLDAWLPAPLTEFCKDNMLRNYKRNEQLIDLSFIPADLSTLILNEFDAEAGKSRSKIFNYFFVHRLKILMESINDF
jgi:hypothetical protein